MAEPQDDKTAPAPPQVDLAQVALVARVFADRMLPPKGAHQSAGFRGTTEGQLSMAIVLLGGLLLAVGVLAPLAPEVSAKLISVGEQLLTYVPIGYALSRGLAKAKEGGAQTGAGSKESAQ